MKQTQVKIGTHTLGDGHPCYVIAEIGLNHNGDINLAKKLIQAAILSGCDAVKFQKRTLDVVFTPEQMAAPRESPFGTTYGEIKRALEFDAGQYKIIDDYCREHGIDWFASCWDEQSVDFIEKLKPVCYKIASATLTDDGLLRHHRKTGRPLILSTGMSTLEEVDHAVEVLGTRDLVIMHCTSTYPAKNEELNLLAIEALKKRYGVPVGYSGHEVGLATTLAARVLGACSVERHITLDRAMWGGDQAASVEPQGFSRLVRDIRAVEAAMGDGIKRRYDSEVSMLKRHRRK
jgi:N-acetylneuraminate synthase